MKKIFYLFAFILFVCQQLSAQTPWHKNSPVIMFVRHDSDYSFGGVTAGTEASYEFEIRNVGNSPLLIKSVKCSSGNIKIDWPERQIKPGKKEYIKVHYTAEGDNGSFNYDVVITSNATEMPYPYIQLTGSIMPGGDDRPGSAPKAKSSRRGH